MDVDEFWAVIESARVGNKPFSETLVDDLAGRSEQEIFEFQDRLAEMKSDVYRFDVWGAAHLIKGGFCSDDGFEDFCGGLVALGRAWYEKSAVNPDSLAEHPAVMQAASDLSSYRGVLSCEEINYVSDSAFKRLTGRDNFYEVYSLWEGHRQDTSKAQITADLRACVFDDGMGEEFNFEDAAQMRQRLPRLAALFLSETAG
jgi:hypothetical protein